MVDSLAIIKEKFLDIPQKTIIGYSSALSVELSRNSFSVTVSYDKKFIDMLINGEIYAYFNGKKWTPIGVYPELYFNAEEDVFENYLWSPFLLWLENLVTFESVGIMIRDGWTFARLLPDDEYEDEFWTHTIPLRQ